MKEEISVGPDLKVTITRLYQWKTYGGLIEGMPVERINNQILNYALQKAGEMDKQIPVHLIEPILTPIPYEGRSPFGDPVAMPSTICIAVLKCYQSIPKLGDYSELTVVWLQEEYAFPIEESILNKLKALSWTQLAKGFNWEDF
jgi:hypothetical protein